MKWNVLENFVNFWGIKIITHENLHENLSKLRDLEKYLKKKKNVNMR